MTGRYVKGLVRGNLVSQYPTGSKLPVCADRFRLVTIPNVGGFAGAEKILGRRYRSVEMRNSGFAVKANPSVFGQKKSLPAKQAALAFGFPYLNILPRR
jgi:hypothetical protein